MPRASPAGLRLAAFLVAYGGARVALGAVRLDPAFIFGLQLEQLLALGSMTVGGVIAARLVLRRNTAPEPLEATAASSQAAANESSLAA